MKTVKLIVILAVSLALVLVVAQNRAPVQTSFLWFNAEMPAILLLLLTGAGGVRSGAACRAVREKWREIQSISPESVMPDTDTQPAW